HRSNAHTLYVPAYVPLTRTHEADPDEPDAAALCRGDVSVLSSDALRYRPYAAGVRREYAHVPDAQFAHARAAILRGLLRRPSLFSTPTGRTRWETEARANLTAEIAELLD